MTEHNHDCLTEIVTWMVECPVCAQFPKVVEAIEEAGLSEFFISPDIAVPKAIANCTRCKGSQRIEDSRFDKLRYCSYGVERCNLCRDGKHPISRDLGVLLALVANKFDSPWLTESIASDDLAQAIRFPDERPVTSEGLLQIAARAVHEQLEREKEVEELDFD